MSFAERAHEAEALAEQPRSAAADIIRCLALFLVASVHFFLHSGFYNEPVAGGSMYLMTLMRTAFMVCVPLFIVLSGYLSSHKRLDRRYYLGLIKILILYALSSAACLLYRLLFLEGDLPLRAFLVRMLNYSASDYAWYMEMYIGLFLLIPFLNILYHGLASRRHKLVLIGTLIVLTALPSVCNIYVFGTAGWWKTPSLSSSYVQVLPAWWLGVYPLSYYCIGCYIREYGIRLKAWLNLVLLLGAILLFGSFNFYRSYGATFVWGPYQDWGALPNVIMTVLLFALLINTRFDQCAPWLKRLLKTLSGLSLSAFLVSCIFDDLFYTRLNAAVPEMSARLRYFPLLVPLVFLCSLLLAFVLQAIYEGGRLCLSRLGAKRRTDGD